MFEFLLLLFGIALVVFALMPLRFKSPDSTDCPATAAITKDVSHNMSCVRRKDTPGLMPCPKSAQKSVITKVKEQK
ncbi:hypothetical protein [Neptuniibacter sp. QD37_11]|uniref:hypothetical protein n=1 Tax=Neptuniibacter sp. QD37_11 TaxID=3398209 RepID=UPI0039F454B2